MSCAPSELSLLLVRTCLGRQVPLFAVSFDASEMLFLSGSSVLCYLLGLCEAVNLSYARIYLESVWKCLSMLES